MKREALLREHGEAGGNLASGNGKAKDIPAFELSNFVSILSLKNTLSVFFRELLLFGVLIDRCVCRILHMDLLLDI